MYYPDNENAVVFVKNKGMLCKKFVILVTKFVKYLMIFFANIV